MKIPDRRQQTQGYNRRRPWRLSRWLLSLAIFFGVPLYFPAELSSSAYTASSPLSVLARLSEKPSPLRWPAAHRGDRAFGHDNSLEAIRGAAQTGIPLIEVDVRRNADGSLFLFHDRRLDEGEMTAPTELMGKRAESLGDHELSLVHYSGGVPSRIATYAEALDAIEPYKTMLQLDVKGESRGVIDQAVRIARQKGQAHQIVIQCQRLSTLAYTREKYPDIAVLARAHSIADIRLAYRKLPDIIQIEAEWITPQIIEEIHTAGSKILVKSLYAMDTVEHWERLFDAGIDILLTDKAAQMVWYLSASQRLDGHAK
jgi:glycerophosphoryl diester phosphodiesterase